QGPHIPGNRVSRLPLGPFDEPHNAPFRSQRTSFDRRSTERQTYAWARSKSTETRSVCLRQHSSWPTCPAGCTVSIRHGPSFRPCAQSAVTLSVSSSALVSPSPLGGRLWSHKA